MSTKPATEQLEGVFCLADFEPLARVCLSEAVFEFIAGGAEDEHTIRWNEEAWSAIRLRPRVLRNTVSLSTEVTLFDVSLPHPIILGPTAYLRTVHPEGELAAARGAGLAAALYTVSTSSTTPVEGIARAATGPMWFQLYMQPDRGFTLDLIHRAEEAGCKAICLTVDTARLGPRNRMQRAGFELPEDMETPHLYDWQNRRNPTREPNREPLTWNDVAWLRGLTGLPILLKGILDPDDAERAVDEGVQGIVVSNHGGRNLDTAVPTADALRAVTERVAGRVTLIVDGGIRRGTDVLKALALGAQAVMIGRPYVYALAAGGAEGVRRCVEILRTEFETAMILTGRSSIEEIDRSVLW